MTTVLVADDEVVERQYLCRLFEKFSGFRLIGQAENGNQAIELTALHKPDIIIMDINMPLSGLEAARVIRQENPKQIIIINTAYANFEYARQALELRLDAYLLKPATPEEVLSTVKNCLQQKERNNTSGNIFSIRPRLAYPHEIAEKMQQSLKIGDSALFLADAAAYLEFFDINNSWIEDYRLYIINTVFGLGRQLNGLRLLDSIQELVDCEGCLSRLKCAIGDELRHPLEDFFRRIGLALQAAKPMESDPVEAACGYIQNHYTENITLSQLAEFTHFSPGYLSRLFNHRMGMTLRSYINKIRVENAAHMLRFSRRGVNDIALDCGFRNLSHFHRIFKEHTGTTPKGIRKQGDTHNAP